jgi:hypothetical protein
MQLGPELTPPNVGALTPMVPVVVAPVPRAHAFDMEGFDPTGLDLSVPHVDLLPGYTTHSYYTPTLPSVTLFGQSVISSLPQKV